jgi:hypothetical protein
VTRCGAIALSAARFDALTPCLAVTRVKSALVQGAIGSRPASTTRPLGLKRCRSMIPDREPASSGLVWRCRAGAAVFRHLAGQRVVVVISTGSALAAMNRLPAAPSAVMAFT